MIKKFKEEALVVEVDIMEDCYPGNPKYIGMQSDKKTNEFLIKSCQEQNLEMSDIEGPFHYYPLCISESEIESCYNDALYSTLNMPVSGLERALLDLKNYSYEPLYKALDVLSSRFANDDTECDGARIDVKRFKNIYRKTFKKQLSICGRVTPYFVGYMRRELQLRNKYLDMLRDKFKEMIAIEKETIRNSVSNTASSFGNSFKPDNNNNAMKIDFDIIFYNAAQYADDPDEMKEYIKREYKKAQNEFYYEKASFFKGILKVVAVERDNAKAGINDQSMDTDTHILVSYGLRYTFEEIDMIEQVVHELCSENKTSQTDQSDLTTNNEYAHLTALQWGAIIYYANTERLLPKNETVDKMLSAFKLTHNIDKGLVTLRNRYYEAMRRINDECNYPTSNLENIIPFLNHHYKETVSKVYSDINFLKTEVKYTDS